MAQREPDKLTISEAVDKLVDLGSHQGWIFLMGQLKTEHDEAVQALAEADLVSPEELVTAQKLQNEIRRYKWFGDTRELLINALHDDEKKAELEKTVYED